MNKEQAAMIADKAEELYPLAFNPAMNQDIAVGNVIQSAKQEGYIAGRTVGGDRERELEEALRKIKAHFGNGESRNPYVKPVIDIIDNLTKK